MREPMSMNVIAESVVISRQSQLVVLSGQVSVDRTGTIVGRDDIAAQFSQVFSNIADALQRVGGELRHLVKCTTYLTNTDLVPVYFAERTRLYPEWFGENPPTNTLLVISSLAREEFLIEVEAMAAIPPPS
jgi:enamine deaminase RidA (YjgF/YER057c/UK114 family)